jgi:hypothetical protein
MDQRSIVLYLNRKGLTAHVIYADLATTLGEEAIAYRTVTKYLGCHFRSHRRIR